MAVVLTASRLAHATAVYDLRYQSQSPLFRDVVPVNVDNEATLHWPDWFSSISLMSFCAGVISSASRVR